MSDFFSPGWSIFVAAATILGLLGCLALLVIASKTKAGETDGEGHVWDVDLRELNNPLPRWWMWLFYLTVIWGLLYLALYPGLGSYGGALGWTQVKQLQEENQQAQKEYGPLYDKFAALDVVALSKNPEALAVGQKLFLNNCAQCHASDGGGSRGFPNLTDADWLWGGTPEAIKASITDGRTGAMPPFGPVLGEQGVKDTAAYVLSLSGQASDSIRKARGEPLFKANCSACHGAEGKGNPALGAPNLTDRIWLHGSGEQAIAEQIARGRINQMPAHKDILSPARIQLLTAYVYSLSRK
jgi:cytochrome c oxidase cbb3-type subunit 3